MAVPNHGMAVPNHGMCVPNHGMEIFAASTKLLYSTQLSQMGKLKNLKKLEKLKPYVLQLNLQPKRVLAITSNDRRE